ncbi:MAG: hypothetical protein MRK02_12895 [Candidatus Scalindua sp.]|nr:hypothetical protein [Candidatus Scalindua sp.]
MRKEVRNDTISQISDFVLSFSEDIRFLITFPISISKRISSNMQLAALRERGIIRILADNTIIDIAQSSTSLDIHQFTSVAGIVDRLVTGKRLRCVW